MDSDAGGEATVPPFAQIAGWSQWTLINASGGRNLEGAVTIQVDGGTYTVPCVLRPWDDIL